MDQDSFTMSVPIETDDHGYWDRRCPWEECGREFKVLYEDWREKVPDERAFCPFCRHEAEPSDFSTSDLSSYFQGAALAGATQRIQEMLGEIARDFNRRAPRGGLSSGRMESSTRRVGLPAPPAAREAMTLRIACEVCGCRFAVIGAGFFCPACGHNSADHTLSQAVVTARNALAALPILQEALTDRDARDQVARNLIEAQIGNLAMAFQRFAEASYPRLPGPAAWSGCQGQAQRVSEPV